MEIKSEEKVNIKQSGLACMTISYYIRKLKGVRLCRQLPHRYRPFPSKHFDEEYMKSFFKVTLSFFNSLRSRSLTVSKRVILLATVIIIILQN